MAEQEKLSPLVPQTHLDNSHNSATNPEHAPKTGETDFPQLIKTEVHIQRGGGEEIQSETKLPARLTTNGRDTPNTQKEKKQTLCQVPQTWEWQELGRQVSITFGFENQWDLTLCIFTTNGVQLQVL